MIDLLKTVSRAIVRGVNFHCGFRRDDYLNRLRFQCHLSLVTSLSNYPVSKRREQNSTDSSEEVDREERL